MTGRGFHLRYSTLCDTEVTGLAGVIESPNFPRLYPHNRCRRTEQTLGTLCLIDIKLVYSRNCTWKIKAPMGNRVNLTFSHFEMEQVLSHILVASFHRQRVQKSLLTRSEMLHPERLCALALRDGKLQLRLPLCQPTGEQTTKRARDRTWKVR